MTSSSLKSEHVLDVFALNKNAHGPESTIYYLFYRNEIV